MIFALSILFIIGLLLVLVYLYSKTKSTFIINKFYIPSLIVFVVLSLCFLGISQLILLNERDNLKKAITSIIPQIETTVLAKTELEQAALRRMKQRLMNVNYHIEGQGSADAQAYLRDLKELLLFGVWSKSGKLQLLESTYNETENAQLINYINKKLFKNQTSIAKSKPLITVPEKVIKNVIGSWIVYSIHSNKAALGYLGVYFDYSILFDDALSDSLKKLVNVRWYYQKQLIYENYIEENLDGSLWTQNQEIIINGYPFTLIIWPTQAFINKYLSWVPTVLLTFGMLISFLFATLIHVWQLLKNSRKNLFLIIDSVNYGIYGLDKQGKTTFFNQAGAKMLGYSVDELVGVVQHSKTHHSYPDGTKYPKKDCPIYSSCLSGKSHVVDSEVFWRKDGTSFPVEYRCEPIWENGKLIGSVVSFSDITQRKYMEQKIKDRNEELEASNNELKAFSYSVSHDLKAPLRHIIGFIDMFKHDQQSKLSEEGQRYLQIISDAAEKMSHLIDDLLQFSRTSRLALNKKTFSLNELIKEVIEEFQNDIMEKNITIDLGALPEIYADETMMRLVIMNLLGNAIKFTSNKEKPFIKISAGEDNRQYVIYIRDNGVGFDPRFSDKIFEVFQRLHKSSEFEGTGIGLAIAAKIINRHDGSIRAESELGKGTTIYFNIPKRKRDE